MPRQVRYVSLQYYRIEIRRGFLGRLKDEEVANLMRAASAGDSNAYQNFFKAILPMLTNMIRTMTPNWTPDLREDVIQEILTSIHAKRHTWRPDKPILPWIYAVARYRVIDQVRKEKRSSNVEANSDAIEALAHPRNHQQELAHDLEQGIRTLNPQTEAVVRAMGIEGKDAKQTASELGISENAARIAFHRGLKKLRAFLSD